MLTPICINLQLGSKACINRQTTGSCQQDQTHQAIHGTSQEARYFMGRVLSQVWCCCSLSVVLLILPDGTGCSG